MAVVLTESSSSRGRQPLKFHPHGQRKAARKKAEAFAATFEKDCREGVTSDSRLKFEEYCNYVIDLKEQRGVKHSTIVRYKELAERIYPAIGHIKLKDLRADHLNSFYTALSKPGAGKGSSRAMPKIDIAAVLKEQSLTRTKAAEQGNIPLRAVYDAANGKVVSQDTAKRIADVLKMTFDKVFILQEEQSTLSSKTILEHHRLISTVLDQAEKEGLVPFNVAAKSHIAESQQKGGQLLPA